MLLEYCFVNYNCHSLLICVYVFLSARFALIETWRWMFCLRGRRKRRLQIRNKPHDNNANKTKNNECSFKFQSFLRPSCQNYWQLMDEKNQVPFSLFLNECVKKKINYQVQVLLFDDGPQDSLLIAQNRERESCSKKKKQKNKCTGRCVQKANERWLKWNWLVDFFMTGLILPATSLWWFKWGCWWGRGHVL